MRPLLTWFDPSPRADELPARMPHPLAPAAPHPLAARAAAEVRAGLSPELGLDRDGKMFGVLVVAAPDGRVGFLRAFSGMVAGRWELPGFAPPAFDAAARDAFWPAGEAGLDALAACADALAGDPAHAALAAHDAEAAAVLDAQRAVHLARREARRGERAVTADPVRLAALDRQSSGDGAARRALVAEQRTARAPLAATVGALDAERAVLDAERTARSRELLVRLQDTYELVSARDERRSLRALFHPAEPPGGAGDCAAPKLLACARRLGLRPVALAEVWCGTPPAAGDRRDGAFYPACRGKCGPILAHLLDGVPCEPPPIFEDDAIGAGEPRTVHEDPWLVVVEKPVGLLSVPGRRTQDSVLARLRARYPDATGPLLVHRLDLDTSGLLVAARDEATHAALQRQFARRAVDKRYIAWLDGDVAGEAGTIDLALRGDLDDRPRQIADPVHGKPAVTAWRVLARAGGRTRVALYPHTGRAHQLRVHAAHARGLGAPVVGDRLYGRPGGRLMLHAEALAFDHPHTGQRLAVERPAPF